MRKLYEKHEVLFAVLWIVAYCVVMVPLKGELGYGSVWMLLGLLAFAAGISAFVKANHLEKKYGLAGWPEDMKRYLWFIPIWVLATGNLWAGIGLSYQGAALLFATLSMMLVGYVEEMLFRGFLLRAMLSDGKASVAVVVCALTFGMGHIVNLFTGQAGFDTVMQMLFAVALGFVFTMAAYKSGSLIPVIIAHAMIDVFSLYGADRELIDLIYMIATIGIAVAYCLYLKKQKAVKTE